MPSALNIAGERFGRLTAIEFLRSSSHGRVWGFKCDCGEFIECIATVVKNGHSQSCGCLQRERTSEAATTHGMSKTSPEYAVWVMMRQRCNNPRNKKYQDYGARGITVCDRWNASFSDFIADMGPRPSSSHSIDRINNDMGYSPDNCRWTTDDVQANNRRNQIHEVIVEIGGVTKTLANWARELGISRHTVHQRIKLGWSPERALTEPARAYGRNNATKEAA